MSYFGLRTNYLSELYDLFVSLEVNFFCVVHKNSYEEKSVLYRYSALKVVLRVLLISLVQEGDQVS